MNKPAPWSFELGKLDPVRISRTGVEWLCPANAHAWRAMCHVSAHLVRVSWTQ